MTKLIYANCNLKFQKPYVPLSRTDPRAISLENHMKKVPYEGRTPRSSRAGKSRTALLEKRTAPLLPQDDGIGTS